ncbi:uncharacterized protein MEPE_04267 [Melanopsichium pennsylvanicum]|uniref:Uncharacterized protein n=1 Tax=Melanopsichium pennsylvanicum TaxID=63383 RepID=A0AAJ5C6H8_9BASI|nr:uncharacterized protein MEPE_04267 [Melanopsichium pennsylvanicum]
MTGAASSVAYAPFEARTRCRTEPKRARCEGLIFNSGLLGPPNNDLAATLNAKIQSEEPGYWSFA